MGERARRESRPGRNDGEPTPRRGAARPPPAGHGGVPFAERATAAGRPAAGLALSAAPPRGVLQRQAHGGVIQRRPEEEIKADVDDIVYRLLTEEPAELEAAPVVTALTKLQVEAKKEGAVALVSRITSVLSSWRSAADPSAIATIEKGLKKAAFAVSASVRSAWRLPPSAVQAEFPTPAEFNEAVVEARDLATRARAIVYPDTAGVRKLVGFTDEQVIARLGDEYRTLAVMTVVGVEKHANTVGKALDATWAALLEHGDRLLSIVEERQRPGKKKKLNHKDRGRVNAVRTAYDALAEAITAAWAQFAADKPPINFAEVAQFDRNKQFGRWLAKLGLLLGTGAGYRVAANTPEDLGGGTIEVRCFVRNPRGFPVKNSSFVVHYHPSASSASVEHQYASRMHAKPHKHSKIRIYDVPEYVAAAVPTLKAIKQQFN